MGDESMRSEATGAELEAWRAGRVAALAACVAWIALSAFTVVSVGWALGVGLLVAVPGVALTACCAVEQGLATSARAWPTSRPET